MKHRSFKTYQLNESYGIVHVEDLDVESFIRSIERIYKLDAVQKLDGANLRAGLDDKGNFFTSREQKGGNRFYKLSDYPRSSSFDGFKTAHTVLEKILPTLDSILSPGEGFNVEVIFGNQPNTVFYGKDGYNYLAILEMVQGDDPSHSPNQDKVKKIVEKMHGKVISVKTDISDTTDGINIVKTPTVSEWKIVTSDHLPKTEIQSLDFEDEIKDLKKMLDKENVTARAAGKDLTNFEVLKDKSKDLADERKSLEEKILNDFKLPIKKKLLDLVGKQKPSLRGQMGTEGSYQGIEGIIFTDPKTREKFKVVDREVFTKINLFNYSARKGVAGKILTSDPNSPVEDRGGITGEAKLRAIRLFGLPNVEIPSQTKRVLEKLKGDSREETVKNIVDSLHQLNYEAIRRKLQAVYIYAIDNLDEALDAFKKNADNYELELENGEKVKYTPEIKRRTLMTFAEARRNLYQVLKEIKSAHDTEDLVELFFSKQLDDLHGSKHG